MTQWQQLLRLDWELQSQVSQVYEGRFPREIRHCLCVGIESQDWDSAAQDESRANACFHALLKYLEVERNRSVEQNNILQGPDFPGMRDYLLKYFQNKPLDLAVILSECLKEEKRILASASGAQGSSREAMGQNWSQLDNRVKELERQTAELKKEIKSLETLNEKLDFIQETWETQVEQHIGLSQSRGVVEEECRRQAVFITQTKQVLLQQITDVLKLAEEIVTTLTGVELPEWKGRQQLACIGSPVDTSLDHLQKWFTAVAEVLLRVHEQLKKLQEQNERYHSADASNLSAPMDEIKTHVLCLSTKLLSNALVVERQPVMSSLSQRPLILKTGVRFSATVRFLANLPEFKCLLKVKPVFDNDAKEAKTVKGFRQFDFARNDCKVLDVDTPDRGLMAEFGLMSIKERKSKGKGSSETRLEVTQELHIIKFVTRFQHAGLQFDIETSSLPVVVVSSSTQTVSAWASIMWCNILSTGEPPNLMLFVDPPPVSWEQLAQVLSWQFLTVGQRELDQHQLAMLREKIVDDNLVHWSKFSKSESGWIWIDGILDLIKKHLVDLWRDGYIMGFVNRKRTRELLQEKQTGTFLLRFSESNKDGAITFSWVEHSNGESHVHAVEPYTKQELPFMCLPDIIYHYSLTAQGTMPRNPLLYLYPDIPKDIAFGCYYKNSAMSTPKKCGDGYFFRRIVPVSIYPTPPSSPPRDSPMTDAEMEIDMDTNVESHQSKLLKLLSDILDLPSFPDFLTTELTPSLCNDVDPLNSC